MVNDLITPKQASDELQISLSTITRCVKLGAPVHRWGSTGTRYRIRVAEFVAWMEAQNARVTEKRTVPYYMDVEEMARRRRAYMGRA